MTTKIRVCDECRTAFYDEGFGIKLTNAELADLLYLGADIGDHCCEGFPNGTCDCGCNTGRTAKAFASIGKDVPK